MLHASRYRADMGPSYTSSTAMGSLFFSFVFKTHRRSSNRFVFSRVTRIVVYTDTYLFCPLAYLHTGNRNMLNFLNFLIEACIVCCINRLPGKQSHNSSQKGIGRYRDSNCYAYLLPLIVRVTILHLLT